MTAVVVSISGRLGSDAVEHRTRTGNLMSVGSLAVAVGRDTADTDEIEWFNLVAFGKVGEDLARHIKGNLLVCMGELARTRYTDRNGVERISWSLTVESLISARAVRPAARRQTATSKQGENFSPARSFRKNARQSSRAPGPPLPNDSVSDLYQ